MNSKLRNFDVFYGVDVFGRGTIGGGGFACDVAVSALKYIPRLGDINISDFGYPPETEDMVVVDRGNRVSLEALNPRELKQCADNSHYLSSVAIFAPGWVLETRTSDVTKRGLYYADVGRCDREALICRYAT